MKCGKSSKTKNRASWSRSLGTVPGCLAANSATARSGTEPTWWTCSSTLGRPAMKLSETATQASLSIAPQDPSLLRVATYVHVGCVRSAQVATYVDRQKPVQTCAAASASTSRGCATRALRELKAQTPRSSAFHALQTPVNAHDLCRSAEAADCSLLLGLSAECQN